MLLLVLLYFLDHLVQKYSFSVIYFVKYFILKIFICIIITSKGYNHIDEESEGEVDDWRKEEKCETNPDLPKCLCSHLIKDQAKK